MGDGRNDECFYFLADTHKSTVVNNALVGNFISRERRSLLIDRGTRFEIYDIDKEGLRPVMNIPLFGVISTISLFKPQNSNLDLLLITTEAHESCILRYNDDNNCKSAKAVTEKALNTFTPSEYVTAIQTVIKGDVSNAIGNRTRSKDIVRVDPKCEVIAMHLYSLNLKIIPFVKGTSNIQKGFDVRLEEFFVIDLVFLKGCAKPTFALIFEDSTKKRFLRSYVIVNEELQPGPLQESLLEQGSSILVPIQERTVLILGKQTVSVLHEAGFRTQALPRTTTISAICKIRDDADLSSFVLGDYDGALYSLSILNTRGGDPESSVDINIEKIGDTSIASCIVYLDNRTIFVGSALGDSQVIRLRTLEETKALQDLKGGDEARDVVELIDSFDNLGPLTDFFVEDLNRLGQGQMISCAGAGKHGSIRIIRSGIGIREIARAKLDGVVGVWNVSGGKSSAHDRFIALSFLSSTRLLEMEGNSVREASLGGFDGSNTSLLVGTVGSVLVQVTASAIRVLNAKTHKLLREEKADKTITLCSSDDELLAVCYSGKEISVLREGGRASLKEIFNTTIDEDDEVACLALSSKNILAVCTWVSHELLLYSLDSSELLMREPIGNDVVPRSLVFSSYSSGMSSSDRQRLLLGLGDGKLVCYEVNLVDGKVERARTTYLGKTPLVLRKFHSEGENELIFACSDRPAVIHFERDRILFSDIDLPSLSHVCAFNHEGITNCFVFIASGSMVIGAIEELKRIHVKTIPLGETPRRLVHFAREKKFVISTMTGEPAATTGETQTNIYLYDLPSLERLHGLTLQRGEVVFTMTGYHNKQPDADLLIVGATVTSSDNRVSSTGRALVYSLYDNELEVVAETSVDGNINCAAHNGDGTIFLGVNKDVRAYKLSFDDVQGYSLNQECIYVGFLYPFRLHAIGNVLSVADYARSVVMLEYDPKECKMTEIGCDFETNWMVSFHAISTRLVLGATDVFNMFLLQRDEKDDRSEEERTQLVNVARINLGEYINFIREGSLVMRPTMIEEERRRSFLYGCKSGKIGTVISLTQEEYDFFYSLCVELRKHITGIGELSHEKFLSFKKDKIQIQSFGFIDGEFVEYFLDLPEEKKSLVAAELRKTVADVYAKVEELFRYH